MRKTRTTIVATLFVAALAVTAAACDTAAQGVGTGSKGATQDVGNNTGNKLAVP